MTSFFNMRKVIGVDVDGVVVRSDIEWNKYLMNRANVSGSLLPLDGPVAYNLSKYYPNVYDAMEFWRKKDLYDHMEPDYDSVKYLKSLSENYDIIFITALKGNHHKSKFNFVKRHFPFMKAFLGTKEKGYVKCDFMIDDRISNLQQFDPEETTTVFLDRGYTQDDADTSKELFDFRCKNWDEIYKGLK